MAKKWEWSPEVEQKEKQKQKWENEIIESGVVVRAYSPNTRGQRQEELGCFKDSPHSELLGGKVLSQNKQVNRGVMDDLVT